MPIKVASACFMFALGCTVATEPSVDAPGALVETHRSIVEGTVLGSANQPLEDVEVVLRFAQSGGFPAPTMRTDGAGRFLFVLAMYNAPGVGADSAAATVYAFARAPFYSVTAADHVPVTVQFLPIAQTPPQLTVVIRLNTL